MNLTKRLSRQAQQRPHCAALVERGRAISFAELECAVQHTAAQLMEASLKPGDTVLLMQPIGVDFYVTLLALLRQGLTAVFVDPGQGIEFVERCCHLVKPRAFIGSAKAHLLRLRHAALRRVEKKFHLTGWVPGSGRLRCFGGRKCEQVRVEPAMPALITFTSGSTGAPKGIMRTHGFLLEQHAVLERVLGLSEEKIELSSLPIFVLANLASGMTSVLADCAWGDVGAADGEKILRQMEQREATRVVGSPAFLRQILEGSRELPGLKEILTGGAPVYPALVMQLRKRFPLATITAVYGSSEAEPICLLAYEGISETDMTAMREGAGLLAGKCVEDLKVAVIQATWGNALGNLGVAEFERLRCGTGEIGEIVVSGAHVLGGYLHGHGDAETKFRVDDEIWHRTGDTGYFDERQRLWLTGRASAVIAMPEGPRLYPGQLETALSFLRGIKASAVLRHENEIVLAVDGDVGSDALQEITRRFGVNKILRMRVPMDRRHRAKVDYAALRREVRRQLAR